jgi:hypothetical protein
MSRTDGFFLPPQVIDVAAVETTPTPLLLRCRTADSGEKNFFVGFYHMLPTRCCQHHSAPVSFDDEDRSQLLLRRKARRSRGMSAIGPFPTYRGTTSALDPRTDIGMRQPLAE